jgi:hypothetical protein
MVHRSLTLRRSQTPWEILGYEILRIADYPQVTSQDLHRLKELTESVTCGEPVHRPQVPAEILRAVCRESLVDHLDWSVWFRNEADREKLKSCPGGYSKEIRYNSGH